MNINFQQYLSTLNTVVSKYYRWFVLLECVVILALGWVFLLQGQFGAIRDSGLVSYEATKQRLDEKKTYLEKLQLMEGNFEELNEERLQQLETVLPVGFDTTSFITNMHSFADAANVNILSIDVVQAPPKSETENATTNEESASSQSERGGSETTDTGDGQQTIVEATTEITNDRIRTANVSLNVSSVDGSYEGLKTFLDVLESFVPILDLQTISYSPSTTSYALQMKTYYFDDSAS